MKHVTIVNHTHWDREWYFSSEDSIALSDKLFTDAIVELENYPKMSFTLDGQISILDDYISIRPEMEDRVKKLVKNDQLLIGPWYTQPDALHIQGESLIRNGMLGIFNSQKYGKYMKVGYLPDTFGFNSQMPVVLNELGLSNFVFWRGINPKKVGSLYFNWKSLGKKNSVTAINMPQGYGTGMFLDDTHDYVDKRLDSAVDFISKIEKSNNILIPSGNDQLDVIKNFEHKVDNINKMGKYDYEISTYQDFINTVERNNDLTDYVGEFIDPVLARVHRTCSSSRMNIKYTAKKLENLLIKQVEPMMVIAKATDVDVSQQLLIRAWEKLLKSQAHDSMAGSVTDPVERDIIQRLKEGIEISDDIINIIENMISKKIGLSNKEVLVFNTEAHKFNGYKILNLITAHNNPKLIGFNSDVLSQKYTQPRENVLMQDETGDHYGQEAGYYTSDILVKIQLPSLGFKVFQYDDESLEENIKSSDNSISNSKLKLSFDDGKLNVQFGDTNLTNTVLIEDTPNDGDTYDYSPLKDGRTTMLEFNSCVVERHSEFSRMILTGNEELPVSDIQKRYSGKTKKTSYKLTILLLSDDAKMRCNFDFKNTVLDHRVRIGFKTGIHTNKHIASVPFGYIERQSCFEDESNWVEKPVDIYPLDNNVTLSNNSYNVSVSSNSFTEYQHTDDVVWLTLLSSTNELGKPNLVYRPGRASGDTTKRGHIMMQTPDAELLGDVSSEFKVEFHNSLDFNKLAQAGNSNGLACPNYQIQDLNLFDSRLDNKIQRPSFDKVSIKDKSVIDLPDDLLVSAIYPSYTDKDSYIIRFENVSSTVMTLDSAIFNGDYVRVNAIEESVDRNLSIDPMGVMTIKVKF
ncbi:glycoside hydrolase family 38 N-terminal domain-containing protein [Companilactobacillus hulinensis]|uniref:glycoside hydrolase family 38 N-terminal domain-containing protein n=1 Tax=Companilactobacillus hulinensis TaxID=2486007 RepID=UPI0013DDFAB1|nr:glycoside hydrolase family 38 C-terminal domain-containing protein [Companilactobacillus hulinensis]